MGSTAPPELAQTGPPPLDKGSTMVHKKGVQINNIFFNTPTVTLLSYACEYGIRRYNYKYMAWRWHIPPMWHGVLTLNLLELLSSVTSIYITIKQLGQGSHILDFTDSSNALGWLNKASFDPVNEETHYMVSQCLGWNLIRNKTYIYSQHIKGK